MTVHSGAYTAYGDSGLTNALNHYVCGGSANGNGVGDWINVTGSTSGATQCTYPITVQVTGKYDPDKGLRTTNHWFSHDAILYDADGGAGASQGPIFSYNWNQDQWYNYLPSSITYNDDHPDNDPLIYVSNNYGFHTAYHSNNNYDLYCNNGTLVMSADYVALPIYVDNNDYPDADWHWSRASQGWSTAGLNQGVNTVYFAGTDGSANYTTGSAQFLYDTVAPNIYFNSNPSGWTAGNPTFSFGATDNASGVAHIWYRISSDGSNWSGWTENSSCTIWDQGGYVLQVMACDNAGNYSSTYSNWVYIDHMPPTVSYNPSSTGWINHSLNVTVTPSDPWCSSGMSQTAYQISNDGGSTWSPWASSYGGSPFNITLRNGDNIIDCNPYDNVGHVSNVLSGHYYIDTVAPTGTITPSTTDYTPSLNLQFNANDTVMYNNTGQIKCTDRDTYVPGTACKTPYWPTGSNFQGVTFRISGQIKKTASADDSKTASVGFFYSPGNGAGNYSWIAAKTWTLSSLNSSWSSFSATITIPTDCGASASDLIPWIQIGVPWGSAGYEVDLQNLKYEVVTASGVNHVINPDGSTVAGSSSSYTVTENGTYTFQAVDNAGNVSSFSYSVTNIAHGNLTGTIEVSDHYYENTDVTGAVDIQYTNLAPVDLTPAMGITVRITAGSQVITQTILCPPNNHSYIPFKFRTPDNPGSSSSAMTIKAEIDPDNKLHELNENDNVLTKQISIDNAEYTEPPETTYQATAPSSWHETDAGSYPSTNTLTWQEWRFENNALVLKNFNVTAAASVQLTPDPRATSSTFDESSNIWTMRSGYGFGNTTTVHVTTNYDRPELITLPQRIRVYFPEFDYDQQNNLRELEQTGQTGSATDYTVTYSFKQNPQSRALAKLHFTPLWFPDGDYNVLENARDIWTPGGQLNMWGTTTLNISGSVYDDWYAGLVPNQ